MSISHFDITIQYGGRLLGGERSYYEGGYTLNRPKFDRDYICKFELESLYKEAGEENGLDFADGSRMVGLGPSRDRNEELCTLERDEDVDQWVKNHEKLGVSELVVYVVTPPFSSDDEDEPQDEEEIIEVPHDDEDEHAIFLTQTLERPEDENIFAVVDGDGGHQSLSIIESTSTAAVATTGFEEDIEDVDFGEFNEPVCNEEIGSPEPSDDEEHKFKFPQFNDEVDLANPKLEVGMEFKNAQVLRKAMTEYCVRKGIDWKWVKNKNGKMCAECKGENCKWRLYASMNRETESLQIKSFNSNCICGRTFDNSHVTSTYIAEKFSEDFEDHPQWKVPNVKNSVRRKISVDITNMKAYRAKRKAQDKREGIEAEQYSKLRSWAETVRAANPGSCIKIHCETPENGGLPRFKRMYVRFAAQKAGFLAGCRPIIGLDACHLKGRFGGQLIGALGRDGNDNMFPIAFAVVEQENKESWAWFMECFSLDMGDPKEMGFVFVSDRQKGLVDVFDTLYPSVEHRYCMRHMYANFKDKYKGKELRDAMWACAFATTPNVFKARMDYMKKLNDEAYKDLLKVDPKLWSISHFSTRALCDDLTNNICESFNNYISEARDKPIISMLEWIRLKLMNRFYVKRNGMAKFGGPYCPNILDKLERVKNTANNCFAQVSGRLIYQIICADGDHVVNLNERTCTCLFLVRLNGLKLGCPQFSHL